LATCFGLAEEQVDIHTPAILKPVPLWTDKLLFSVMICPNKDVNVLVSFEMKEKNYNSNLKLKHFSPDNGYLCFRNNELISGNVAKKTIGGGSKSGLLYILL
jgi:DNA-directed RNA polymerase III subunit RPC1